MRHAARPALERVCRTSFCNALSPQLRPMARLAYSTQSTPPAVPGTDGSTKTLAQILSDSIKSSGPLSVSTFMRTCLLNPGQGYYSTANNANSTESSSSRQVLGARGDFITNPEISQVFGELLAIFFVARWQATTFSEKTRLVELGPGKGTLLADMLRTFSQFKSFFKSLKEIHLVETSPGLMSLQHDAISEALAKAGKRLVGADKEELEDDEIRVEWFPLVDSVPIQNDTWSMVVAHEFFDALPIHIFERTSGGFREVLVDVERKDERKGGITVLKPNDLYGAQPTQSSKTSPPKFRYVLSANSTPWSLLLAERNQRFKDMQPGQRVEISPEGWATARRIGELVAGRAAKEKQLEGQDKASEEASKAKEAERIKGGSKGGVGLVIDYGDQKAFGQSFRAFKQHQIVDPLEEPGTVDLTANVDFAHLKSAIATSDARSLGPMQQLNFLKALGLNVRVETLIDGAKDEQKAQEIRTARERLLNPLGMGSKYKMMGITAEEVGPDGTTEGEDKCYPFEMQS